MIAKTISEMRVETQQLQKRLEECQPGDMVTYQELSKLVGLDVQSVARHLLTTARDRAESNGGLFSAIRGEGLRRLYPNESPAEVDGHRERLRRIARKGMRRSRRIDFNALSEEQKVKLNTTRTVLAFVCRASSDRAVAKLTTAVTESATALSFAKTLAKFSK